MKNIKNIVGIKQLEWVLVS